MSNWRINRRTFIASTGATLLLPFLESFSSKKAYAAGNDPKRFIGMYMPNGTYNTWQDPVWYQSTGNLVAGSAGTVLAPFTQAQLTDFSLVKYMSSTIRDMESSKTGAPHIAGPSTFLTQSLVFDPKPPGGREVSAGAYVTGTSFDQLYATASGKQSLALGMGTTTADPLLPVPAFNNTISYVYDAVKKTTRNITTINDPVFLWQNMFAKLSPTAGQAASRYVRNKSVLDASVADLNELKSALGKIDNDRLDDYLTNLRALETQLAAAPPVAAGQCQPIANPDPTGTAQLSKADPDGSLLNYNPKMKAFLDMIVLAFKCDMVRSIAFMYDAETDHRVGWQFGGNPLGLAMNSIFYNITPSTTFYATDHIGISHYGTSGIGKNGTITRDRYRMAIYIYLLNQLKAAKDPSGAPILDNTIVLNAYNLSDGNHGNSPGWYDTPPVNTPSNNRMTPCLVGGGKNLGFTPGRSIDARNFDMKDLFYTFNTKLGMGLANFAGNTGVIPL